MKSLFEMADDYKKGTFIPKNFLWEYEVDWSENYSLFITNKKDKKQIFAFDGAKDLNTIKAVGKMFNVRPKEKK